MERKKLWPDAAGLNGANMDPTPNSVLRQKKKALTVCSSVAGARMVQVRPFALMLSLQFEAS